MKKLFMVLGIILLLGAGLLGVHTFNLRHENNELVKMPAPQKLKTTPKPVVPTFNKAKLATNDPSSLWVVVNKKRPLTPVNFAPNDLVDAGNNQQLRKDVSEALAKLITAAKAENLTIQPLSGYRSYVEQITVYNNEVANYGQKVADTESAKPGTSEHQTGLGVDVGGGGCGIEDCFGTTAEGKWVALHAYEYGFIVRYTAAKQSITGYRAEPWHLRYIGSELSQEMHKQNISTLEEFFKL